MKSIVLPKGEFWAKVPHGIIDAAIPDMAKLLLWYCYDKPAEWTFSVADVALSLDKSPQWVRRQFKIFVAAGVFTYAGEKQNRYGRFPVYTFDPAQVDAFVKSQLMVNPETDPETDVETSPETQVETDPETNLATTVSHNKNDIPILNSENKITMTENSENYHTKGIDAGDFKKAFADLDSDFKSQPPNPLMKEITSGPLSKVKSLGEQPPQSAAVAPEHPVNAVPAEGGGSLGIPSMPVVPSAASTTIQAASGKSNDGGDGQIGQETFTTSAPIVQPSVNGTANTGAPGTVARHPGTSAQRAEGTTAESGGARGDIPTAVKEHAEWMVRQAKKSSPYTNESFDIIEQELMKRLADFNWSLHPEWSDPRQEVNILLPKLISEFGKRK